MTIKFIGDEFTATERVLTGLHSLDWALEDVLGNIGWPVPIFTEVYGDKGVGKTSFCVSLLGLIANKIGTNFTFLDWEGQNKETIRGVLEHSGFDGTIDYVLNVKKASGKFETSEETLERWIGKLYDDPQPVALMDSLGAFRPTAYTDGSIADSNMGVFAREAGRAASRVIAAMQRVDHPTCVVWINHKHPTIGGYSTGHDTSGGVTKKYLAQLRIDLRRTFLKTKKDPNDKDSGSIVDLGYAWLLGGRIDNSRVSFSRREFNVFMIAGEGIHKGLTAVFDCVVLGLADVSSKKVSESVTIALDGKQYKLRTLIDKRDDDEMFIPFHNTLMANSLGNKEEPVKVEKKTRGRKKK